LEDAKAMVRQAIRAGIFNDLGSGSNVDLCVITKDHVDYLRGYDIANPRPEKLAFNFPRGITPIWRDLSQIAVEEGQTMQL
jgi:20S proteasome subunit beta 2